MIQITEPTTLITDYILTAVGLFLGAKLLIKNKTSGQKTIKYFAATLLFFSLGFFFGGTYHGFKGTLGPLVAGITWQIATYLGNIMGFFIILAGSYLVKNAATKKILLIGALLKLTCFLAVSSFTGQFMFLMLDYGISIIILALILVYLAAKNITRKPALIMLSGLGVSVLAGLIQFLEISPHQYFNNNDLYHTIQLIGIPLIYLGAKSLKDA